MMKNSLVVMMALVLMLSTLPAVAQENEAPSAIAYKVETPIVIDGILDEWKKDCPIVIEREEQVIRDVVFWNGNMDCSGTVYLMWDDANLYIAVEMNEDSPFGAIEMLPLDGEDNFKIYLSTNPADDPNRQTYSTNDFLLYLVLDNEYWDTGIDRSMVPKDARQRFVSVGMDGGESALPGYQAAAKATTTGFTFEAVIPFVDLTNQLIPVYTPSVGDTINFNFAITDISYPCPGTEYIPQLAWTGDLNINQNPSLWGRLTFQ